MDKSQGNVPSSQTDTSKSHMKSCNDVYQLFIDISCLDESDSQNCLVFNSNEETVSAHSVIK